MTRLSLFGAHTISAGRYRYGWSPLLVLPCLVPPFPSILQLDAAQQASAMAALIGRGEGEDGDDAEGPDVLSSVLDGLRVAGIDDKPESESGEDLLDDDRGVMTRRLLGVTKRSDQSGDRVIRGSESGEMLRKRKMPTSAQPDVLLPPPEVPLTSTAAAAAASARQRVDAKQLRTGLEVDDTAWIASNKESVMCP